LKKKTFIAKKKNIKRKFTKKLHRARK